MIDWYWPWAFVLLPLPLIVRHVLIPRPPTQAALTVPDLGRYQVEAGLAQSSTTRRHWPLLLLAIAWVGVIAALARPHWTGDATSLPVSGRDLMLSVDISGSMGTEDLMLGGSYVDRLTVVKAVVADFIAQRQGDRVGLILFGTNAYLQAPLTFDLTSVNRLLQEAPVGIAGGKTAIGDAIGLAVKRLRQRPESQRVLILLTDGANNVGEVTPTKAAELAAESNVRIYSIGVGATEMQMPGIFGSFGARVVNPSADLDEPTLRSIADITGGAYYRAQNTDELAGVYDTINELEEIEQDPQVYRPVASLAHWPLLTALLAFCALLWLDIRGAR